jgi:hypothetical protein
MTTLSKIKLRAFARKGGLGHVAADCHQRNKDPERFTLISTHQTPELST